MAENLVIYAIAHQPRRVRLPANVIPPGTAPEEMAPLLFDEKMNERYFRKVARYCYKPATELWLRLLDSGLKLSFGISLSLIRQAKQWEPSVLDGFKRIVAHPNTELIGVDPYHSFLMLIDLPDFTSRMKAMADELNGHFGKRPTVTDTTEMLISETIAGALESAGFRGALMDGREWILGWRQPTHLYYHRPAVKLLARHYELSDDVGYRFSQRQWAGWPLMADDYAHWIRRSEGQFVMVGWDFETFGEHQYYDSGVFEFMEALPGHLKREGVIPATAGEVIDAYGSLAHELSLPAFPSTWAGSGGAEFFLGNGPQRALFQLMTACYHKAQLTGNETLVDLALWLTQSDNLHLINWWGRWGSEAEVSVYFMPDEWWNLGVDGIIWEQQCVYKNFLSALDSYL